MRNSAPSWSIAARTARYVKLNVTTPTQTTDTAARIYELEVYGSPASKAEIMRRILAEHALSPHEVVFVGDALSDYEGARAVDVPFVARVPRGDASIFPDHGVLATVPDLRQSYNGVEFQVNTRLSRAISSLHKMRLSCSPNASVVPTVCRS